MRSSGIAVVLVLATAGVIGNAAPVCGQAPPPSPVEAEILWQFDTEG